MCLPCCRLHGSPLLSSPEHQLFEDWQKARAGLAKGHPPRLAPAGTGGSYFISGEDGMPVALFKPNDEVGRCKGALPCLLHRVTASPLVLEDLCSLQVALLCVAPCRCTSGEDRMIR